ncbi:hypothetical protein J8J40_30820, partial [Mycobacterium tuberculosis]|nr:hypothetical protein [Mycobacterium tuberculosis]
MRPLLAALIVAAFGLPLPAAAQPAAPARTCRIADPSPTPTNLRTAPAGDVVGTIANGSVVDLV